MSVKISLVGPGRLKTVPMFGYANAALKRLGHDVECFNFSPAWPDRLLKRLVTEKRFINRAFRSHIREHQPELVIFIYGFYVSLETLSLLKSLGIRTACWWLNDPFQLKRSLEKAPHYDYLFSNAQKAVDVYRNRGIKNSYWLPVACEPSVHKKMPIREEWRSEVCFAGDWSPMREHWCNLIASRYRFKLLGPWKKKLLKDSPLHKHIVGDFFSPDEMSTLFSSTQMVFNIHTWRERWEYGTNPRVFEASGCGAAQLVDFRTELPELFNTQESLIVYRDESELTQQIDRHLNRGDVLSRIGQSAQTEAYQKHTYDLRMREMLSICDY